MKQLELFPDNQISVHVDFSIAADYINVSVIGPGVIIESFWCYPSNIAVFFPQLGDLGSRILCEDHIVEDMKISPETWKRWTDSHNWPYGTTFELG